MGRGAENGSRRSATPWRPQSGSCAPNTPRRSATPCATGLSGEWAGTEACIQPKGAKQTAQQSPYLLTPPPVPTLPQQHTADTRTSFKH
ncbi:hypothetical protein E2C01_075274 [Portunus trituberculatus]|uniref:Uncharacterized protein n=1 Tax=Portunus trituberculatus TaxID=210409 RepID=A0A5B7IIQ2_PORTR|nr:hypothetical protein [Portunus trituberculatus]